MLPLQHLPMCLYTTTQRHHIASCRALGRGIQARTPNAHEVAFHKEEYIWELIGQLEPLKTPADAYSMTNLVNRVDIPGFPAVRQLV